MKKHSIEEVAFIIKDNGYDLITTNYKNAHQKLVLKDNQGYLYYSSFDNISHGKKPFMYIESNPFSIRNLQTFIQNNHLSCTCNMTSFNNVLTLKCVCGRVYTVSWDKFLHSKNDRCSHCTHKRIGYSKRVTKSMIIEKFNDYNLIPIEPISENCFSTKNILCKDKNGYLGKISYHNLDSRNSFGIFSLKNEYLYDNINNFINLNHADCHLVTQDFSNYKKLANAKLEFECECGQHYDVSWRSFMFNKVFRCPHCSHKNSKYEIATYKWLSQHNICFEKEYTFWDCKDKGILRFDVCIKKNNMIYALIEVDGEFHYINNYDNNEDYKRRDEIKNNYCKEHNYKLIRIPYWEYNNNNYKQILSKELEEII